MTLRSNQLMWNQLLQLDADSPHSLQKQLRIELTQAIVEERIPIDTPLPSSREMAKQLGISRNTVVLACQRLIDDGYLISRERLGYFVNPGIIATKPDTKAINGHEDDSPTPNWESRLQLDLSSQRNIRKPADWPSYKYPFIYGQSDPSLFPIAEWRECLRESHRIDAIVEESYDYIDRDDSLLVEQLCSRVLPRRGIWTSAENILVTMGAQNALSLATMLLLSSESVATIENPGYPDVRNLVQTRTRNIRLQPTDEDGLVVDESLADSDLVFVTPSHQFPTMGTMSLPRREELLNSAIENDFIIVEDDYESEASYIVDPLPSIKSIDATGRVLYCGSMSKSLAPGLRLGYIVGDAEFIRHARMLRRLLLRHPPPLIQRTVALFLQLGHYDSHIAKLNRVYRSRWELMGESIEQHLPGTTYVSEYGGSAYWLHGPDNLDTRELARTCAQQSILIEPGDVHFGQSDPPKNYFRLGFSSIADDRIEPGIRKIAQAIVQLTS